MNATKFLTRCLEGGVLASLLAVTLGACQSSTGGPELSGRDNMWAGDAIRSASLNEAIRTQRTLYAYHFETGSAGLNDLGQRDLRVLAEPMAEKGGEINVRRGDASAALYEARLASVQECLLECGVQGGKVSIRDGLPGGQGLGSERVIVLLKEKMSAGGIQTTTSAGGSGTSAGVTPR